MCPDCRNIILIKNCGVYTDGRIGIVVSHVRKSSHSGPNNRNRNHPFQPRTSRYDGCIRAKRASKDIENASHKNYQRILIFSCLNKNVYISIKSCDPDSKWPAGLTRSKSGARFCLLSRIFATHFVGSQNGTRASFIPHIMKMAGRVPRARTLR
jgi:hypothetical protein